MRGVVSLCVRLRRGSWEELTEIAISPAAGPPATTGTLSLEPKVLYVVIGVMVNVPVP